MTSSLFLSIEAYTLSNCSLNSVYFPFWASFNFFTSSIFMSYWSINFFISSNSIWIFFFSSFISFNYGSKTWIFLMSGIAFSRMSISLKNCYSSFAVSERVSKSLFLDFISSYISFSFLKWLGIFFINYYLLSSSSLIFSFKILSRSIWARF